jgi:hypothetical protein
MMRNFFRSHQGDEASSEQGGWLQDPTRAFEDRYHDGSRFTPFVRIPRLDRVLWDLCFAGRLPEEGDREAVDGAVLQAAGRRIECDHDNLRVSWRDPDGSARMRAVMPLARLIQLEPATANEDCVGLLIRAAPAKPVRTGPGESLSISLTFPPQHEGSVHDFCVFTEQMCGRPLTGMARTGARSAAPMTRKQPGHSGTAGSAAAGQPHVRLEVPASAAGAQPHPAAADSRFGREDPRQEHPQASDRLLMVSAMLVPDNDEWLTFAAPTVEELLAAEMAGDGGSGRGERAGSAPAWQPDLPPTS